MIVDVSVNLRGHTSLPFYKLKPAAMARGGTAWTAETLRSEMDSAGVDVVGLIASVATHGVGGAEDPIHVNEVKPLLDTLPGRTFGWVGINPSKKPMETVRYIDHAVRELGFKGVHCYPHWFGIRVDDPVYYPIYSKCAELGVPITLQVGTQTLRAGARLVAKPEWLDRVAFDFPELTLIGLHIGIPWTNEMIMLCKNYENVYIIADGHNPASFEPQLIDYISGRGRNASDGHTKVMWGTDWPIQLFSESLAEVHGLGLEPDVKAALIGGNAARIFGLTAPSASSAS
ncbi:MAG TPA: amidohydrolase family protein [Streptosporangiaceae bacterium]|nr:amidohydrolase family protein [Streptosporangiaceae bacterium]